MRGLLHHFELLSQRVSNNEIICSLRNSSDLLLGKLEMDFGVFKALLIL